MKQPAYVYIIRRFAIFIRVSLCKKIKVHLHKHTTQHEKYIFAVFLYICCECRDLSFMKSSCTFFFKELATNKNLLHSDFDVILSVELVAS